jgi:hypothetical protein
MLPYRHTQPGTLVLAALAVPVVVIACVSALVGLEPVSLLVAVILLACALLFGSLGVEVTGAELCLWFGVGLIRRRFPLAEIRRATRVRNRWYWGWGIRRMPRGWLYNVSGLEAVEIEMADGRIHRVGTDRPEELLAALASAGVSLGPTP